MHHWQLRVFARMHCLPVQESGLVWSCRLTAWSRCFVSCHSVEGMDKVDNEKGQENVLIFVTTCSAHFVHCCFFAFEQRLYGQVRPEVTMTYNPVCSVCVHGLHLHAYGESIWSDWLRQRQEKTFRK